MYLIQIILEGFKSYPNRTEISGFDPAFNAITGKNGHGKSNVLDGICFVLGITNLSQVRGPHVHPPTSVEATQLRSLQLHAITLLSRASRLLMIHAMTPVPQVRAENLNALIYKNGQAGVTKATVTLVFDNTDPKQQPMGYEQCHQITVTRQVCLTPSRRE
jgi:structural maintenance of chromosome 2